jgi:hypothetical protein
MENLWTLESGGTPLTPSMPRLVALCQLFDRILSLRRRPTPFILTWGLSA